MQDDTVYYKKSSWIDPLLIVVDAIIQVAKQRAEETNNGK